MGGMRQGKRNDRRASARTMRSSSVVDGANQGEAGDRCAGRVHASFSGESRLVGLDSLPRPRSVSVKVCEGERDGTHFIARFNRRGGRGQEGLKHARCRELLRVKISGRETTRSVERAGAGVQTRGGTDDDAR